MTTEQPSNPAVSLARPQQKLHRKHGAYLAPDAAARQSRVTLLAWKLLGAEAAIAFLNGHCAALDARPLDLAVASAGGCEAVERAIAAHAEME